MSTEPMRRVDAAWYHMDRPQNTADIVALLRFAGRVPFRHLKTLIADRLLSQEPFRQRVVGGPGAPRWEEDPVFDLSRHIELRRVEPGTSLHCLLGSLASGRLDPAHPLWHIAVLESTHHTSLALKVHHCMGDGRALVGVLQALGDEPVPEPAVSTPAYRRLRLVRHGLSAVEQALSDPAAALRLIGEAAAFAGSLARLAALPADGTTHLNRPLTGERRVASTVAMSLPELRAACRSAGLTVNELMVSAVAGALRTVLMRAGQPVDQLQPRALMPVDAREPTDRFTGNGFGLVFFDLPVRYAKAEDRVAAVRARSAALRKSPEALVTLAVLGGLGLLPRKLEQVAASFFSHKASLVLTNVRGPTSPVHLGGALLDRLLFWVPHPVTLGLGVSIISYAGRISVGVRADTGVLPNPSALVRALELELRSLGIGVERPATFRRRFPSPTPAPLPPTSVQPDGWAAPV